MPSIKKAVWEKALRSIEELTSENKALTRSQASFRDGVMNACRLSGTKLCMCKMDAMTDQDLEIHLHELIKNLTKELKHTKNELKLSQRYIRNVTERAMDRLLEKQ